jgi:hypothetical protein
MQDGLGAAGHNSNSGLRSGAFIATQFQQQSERSCSMAVGGELHVEDLGDDLDGTKITAGSSNDRLSGPASA